MSTSENPKATAALKKYLKPSALRDTMKNTFVAYLGKNSTEADYEAFLEYVDSEYLSNECQKLSTGDAVRIGVWSLLDNMSTATKGRAPSLNALLDEQAYQDGNTATLDYYLGARRTREEEQEFRQRLAFIKDIFDLLLDEAKAQAVAEYMLGPLKDDDDEDGRSEEGSDEEPSDSDRSEDVSDVPSDDDDDVEEPSDSERSEDGEEDRRHTRRHKAAPDHHHHRPSSSHRARGSSSRHY